MIQPSTDYRAQSHEAETLDIYVCPDDHVHFVLCDKVGNALAEISWSPEEALAIAKKIEAGADHALGIA